MQPTSYCSFCYSLFPGNTQFIEKKIHKSDLVLKPEESTPLVTKCHHLFHAHCLHIWLATFRDTRKPVYCIRCPTNLLESDGSKVPSSSRNSSDEVASSVLECKEQLYSECATFDADWDASVIFWGKLDEMLQESVHAFQKLADNNKSNTSDRSLEKLTKFDIGPWRAGINKMKTKGVDTKRFIDFHIKMANDVKTVTISALDTIQGLRRSVFLLSAYEDSMKCYCILDMITSLNEKRSEIEQTESHLQQNALEQEVPKVIALLNQNLEKVICWDFKSGIKIYDY